MGSFVFSVQIHCSLKVFKKDSSNSLGLHLISFSSLFIFALFFFPTLFSTYRFSPGVCELFNSCSYFKVRKLKSGLEDPGPHTQSQPGGRFSWRVT